MRRLHPRPRRPHAPRLERIVEQATRALHDDAHAAMHALRLYPGAPAVDPQTLVAAEGWSWERRHLLYGATEALFLLDEDEKLLATILPPSLSPTADWYASLPRDPREEGSGAPPGPAMNAKRSTFVRPVGVSIGGSGPKAAPYDP